MAHRVHAKTLHGDGNGWLGIQVRELETAVATETTAAAEGHEEIYALKQKVERLEADTSSGRGQVRLTLNLESNECHRQFVQLQLSIAASCKFAC